MGVIVNYNLTEELAHGIYVSCLVRDLAEELALDEPVVYQLKLAGVLHDIGKLYEMDSNEYGIVSEYTVEGELLGHLVMGAMIVKDAAQKVNAGMDYEKILVLQHMLASHHGPDPEMGSARKPCILESYLLHEIDMIDMYAYVADKDRVIIVITVIINWILRLPILFIILPPYYCNFIITKN